MKNIKFIWDFRGPGGLQTATHHQIHLEEFCKMEGLSEFETGVTPVSDMHAIAFVVTPAEHLALIRDRLRPHRAVQA